jgi:hypothetical protein
MFSRYIRTGLHHSPLRDDVPYFPPIGSQVSGESIVGVTRAGGIAARSTTSAPHTFPSATIDLLDPNTGAALSPPETQVVFNVSETPVPEETVIKAIKIGDRYFAVHGDGEAILITFNLLTDLPIGAGAVANAGITYTTDPANFPVGVAVVVYNTVSAPALAGSEGVAIFIDERWHVIQVNRPQPFFHIDLTCNSHDWTAETGSSTVRGGNATQTIPITYGFSAGMSSFPNNFNQFLNISNPYNLHWETGDRALVRYFTATEYFVVKVFKQRCTRFRFRLTANAPNGLTPNLSVVALAPTNTEGGPPPTGTVTVRDDYYLAHNARIGHKGVAEWDYNNSRWFVTQCEHWATRVLGTLSGAFSGTPPTFRVICTVGLNGQTPNIPAAGGDPANSVLVQNRYSWEAGANGHNIEIEWNPVNGQWIPVQMRCPN